MKQPPHHDPHLDPIDSGYICEASVVNVRGYLGLPEQFVVLSAYGYLGKDSFAPLERATIFSTREEAQARLTELYPHFEITNRFA